MKALSSNESLQLWECGQYLHPLDQGLLALEAAAPGLSWEDLAGLPLGERNRRLLELRAACFGDSMSGWVACPQCGERLEFAIRTRDLLDGASSAPEIVTAAGHTFRLPTSRDLAVAAREPDPQRGALRLLEQCLLDRDGEAAWSGEEVEAVGEELAAADPLAETLLALNCSCCSHTWNEALDVAAFLWTELEVEARRLLHDVHVLASAYHWSEPQILALSERRRTAYLEMVRA